MAENMYVDKLIVDKKVFLESLQVKEISEFVFWIENTFVEHINSQEELIERFSQSESEEVVYTDDAGFEAGDLAALLERHGFAHEFIEADYDLDDE